MMTRIKLVFVLIVLTSFSVDGQELKLKLFGGTARYQGDLAPYSFINATSDSHFTLAFSIGLKLSDFYSINLRYLTGKLSGNDALSSNAARKSRNLRFESPLDELGLISELDINNLFWNGKSKYGIHFILVSGVNIFHINPRTDYNGNIYFLQPLGTEGQWLSESSTRPYKLTQWNIPYGLAIEFKVGDHVNMGIDISSRYTFTDYIDDVSGNYPDFYRMAEEIGEVASALSNRTGELLNKPGTINPGDPRGNPDNNDWYLVTGVYLSYYFGKNPIMVREQKGNSAEGGELIFPD